MPERDAPSPTLALVPVSPKLMTARLTLLAAAVIVLAVGVGALATVAPAWLTGLLAAALVIGAVWVSVVIVRQVRHIGYREREHDLLIGRGVMFRTTTVVPYGRMQYVEVSSGPIDRMIGLAKVELHTASASSDAVIPGMTRDDAERLRDDLAARGEAHLAGL